jgi:hypothetical protein
VTGGTDKLLSTELANPDETLTTTFVPMDIGKFSDTTFERSAEMVLATPSGQGWTNLSLPATSTRLEANPPWRGAANAERAALL